jgi:hypothetical protein
MSHYTINWLAVVNDLISGFLYGAGFCWALLTFYLIVNGLGKKKEAA